MKSLVKKILRLFPIGFFKLWRSLGRPRFYKYLTVKGNFSTKLSNQKKLFLRAEHDLYIEKEIFWNGIECEFEPFTLKKWSELSEKANVIFDIGANTGIFSMLGAKFSPGKVHSFEPVPYNFNILKKNTLLNPDVEVQINQLALSDHIGESSMQIQEGINYINSLNENRYETSTATTELKVRLSTVDHYIEENKILSLDLMKIDVEGHEVSVLKGAKESLIKFKPSIIIEVLNEEMGTEIQSILDEVDGYRFYHLNEEKEELEERKNIITSERTNYLISVN